MVPRASCGALQEGAQQVHPPLLGARRILAAGTKTHQQTQTKKDGDGEEGGRGGRGARSRRPR